jgi:hypothetical protein
LWTHLGKNKILVQLIINIIKIEDKNKDTKYRIFEFISFQTMKKIISLGILCAMVQGAYPQWTLLSNDFEPNFSISAYDSIIIAGCSDFGTYDLAISYDYGNTWVGNDLFPSNGVGYLCTVDSLVYACNPNGIFKTAKDTINWSPYNEGLPAGPINKICMKDSILLACNGNTLFIRGLEDSSWSVLSDNIPQDYITGFDFDGNLIVVAGSDGVCESYDMGASWSLWTDLQFTTGIIVIKGDTIIHASPGGVTRKLISTGNLADVSSGLIKLWTPPPGWDYYGTLEQFHKIGDNIFLCGETGLYKLSDDMWYWELTGLEYTNALADNGDKLFAATYSGIWGRPLNQLIVNTNEYPVLLSSINIYPNPASDHISISAGRIIQDILVYDNLGRLAYEAEPGKSFINLALQDYRPGIYFIFCRTKDELTVNKIIINHY